METLPPTSLFSILHMAFLGFWGGVVATESVLEVYPYRRRELHQHTIQFHYWIDLIVELPLVIGVVATLRLSLRRHGRDEQPGGRQQGHHRSA